MTTREITRNLGIPARNLLNWRNSSPSDWRYKTLMFLEDKQVTPDMVEKALTVLPEVQPQTKPESIPDLVSQIKELQAQVRDLQGAADDKLRPKPREA